MGKHNFAVIFFWESGAKEQDEKAKSSGGLVVAALQPWKLQDLIFSLTAPGFQYQAVKLQQ